nr:hypothetical protein [Tanacetum cinerariifolium]
EASEDDDGVFDKLSLDSRSKEEGKKGKKGCLAKHPILCKVCFPCVVKTTNVMIMMYYNVFMISGTFYEVSSSESKVLGQNGFSAYVSAGFESDGPIRRIHGYGYGVLKSFGLGEVGFHYRMPKLRQLIDALPFKAMKVKIWTRGLEVLVYA